MSQLEGELIFLRRLTTKHLELEAAIIQRILHCRLKDFMEWRDEEEQIKDSCPLLKGQNLLDCLRVKIKAYEDILNVRQRHKSSG